MSLVQSIRMKYNNQSSQQPALHDGSGSSSGAAGASGGRQRVELRDERIARKQARLDAFKVSDAQGLIEQVPPVPYLYVLTLAFHISLTIMIFSIIL